MFNDEKIKILLVEDDVNFGIILKEFLQLKNFEVKLATNGEEGSQFFSKSKYDLCIFDIMMPKMDGFSLAKIVRAKDKNVPIIFLSAKSMLEDKINGFEIGADDYITKPFSTEELFLRINAILKRTNSNSIASSTQFIFKIGKYLFDYEKRLLTFEKKERTLTSKEGELLRLFCLSMNDVLPRTTALESIWTEETYFTSRSMDVYVAKIRKYLKDDPAINIINIHGKGFKLLVE